MKVWEQWKQKAESAELKAQEYEQAYFDLEAVKADRDRLEREIISLGNATVPKKAYYEIQAQSRHFEKTLAEIHLRINKAFIREFNQ